MVDPRMEDYMKFNLNYDKTFDPISVRLANFKKEVSISEHKPLKICVERNDGYNYIYNIDIFCCSEKNEENYGIVERIIKSILWV